MVSLAKKLGIKPGQAVCLINAPAEVAARLHQECPEQVTFSDILDGRRYDIIILWPTHLSEPP